MMASFSATCHGRGGALEGHAPAVHGSMPADTRTRGCASRQPGDRAGNAGRVVAESAPGQLFGLPPEKHPHGLARVSLQHRGLGR